MNSGMYAALTGNINAMKRLDVVANNLANTNTAGFKKDRLTFETLLNTANASQQAPGKDATPVFSGDRFFTDYSAGPFQQTGNPLDVALEGDGFFVVTTPQGNAYTRQGNFRQDSGGRMVTADGYPLSPEVIIPPTARKVTIGGDGTISAFMPGDTAPVTIGTLQVVDFPKPYALQKVAGTLFVPADPQAVAQPAPNTTVSQGTLEGSNVSAISEMVQMIEANRYFESCAKVVKSFDDLAAKAANEMGKV